MFLESSPELLVLLLQGADVSVFLLNAENKMGAWPVVCDFVKVLHVFLILPHSVHLLQHLLRPAHHQVTTQLPCSALLGQHDLSPGDQVVRGLVVVPQPGGEPLGVRQKLLHREGHIATSLRCNLTLQMPLFSAFSVNGAAGCSCQ